MKKDIPNFLIEMSKQMNEQPSRCTSHPFWQVRCKRQITCAEGHEDYWVLVDVQNEYHEIYSTKTCDSDYFFGYMREHYLEWVNDWEKVHKCEFHPDNFDVDSDYYDLPDGYEEIEKIPMQEVEEVVTTHLTQHDAEWFIKQKQHGYPKLYTYVESAYWSPQLRQLQNWIKEISNDAKH